MRNKKSISLPQRVISLFDKNYSKAYSFKSLCRIFDCKNKVQKKILQGILINLEKQKRIIQPQEGRYLCLRKGNIITGRLDFNRQKNAYLVSENTDKDIFISSKDVGKSFHNDIVEAMLFSNEKNRRFSGLVTKVVERFTTIFIGKVDVILQTGAFISPSDDRISRDFFISTKYLKQAKVGDVVEIKFVRWDDDDKNPVAKVTKVLGKDGDYKTTIGKVLSKYGLDTSFPKSTDNQLSLINSEIAETEIKNRKDFRTVTTFTIDPLDAKDFDDAISFSELNNGGFQIGVHIADVSHYIQPNTPLDKEAFRRATSVYLPNQVVPMLPEKISNQICSLRPDEEKLCFSAVFDFNSDFDITNEWFGKTIIKSNKRFTYQEALETIEKKEGNYTNELNKLNLVAENLREKRAKKGVLDFDRKEVKFQFNDKGIPENIVLKEANKATKLIEEFMLLANRKVAEWVNELKQNWQFIYRTHASPDEEKVHNLMLIVNKMGYDFKPNQTRLAKDLNQLMKTTSNSNESNLITTLSLRTMAKATYTTKNIGHFGLSFNYYTHFTSPIRRYPDVLVHRKLFELLTTKKVRFSAELEDFCKHFTDMEIKATEAERDAVKLIQVKFLENRVGETFSGVVTGVSQRGIFIELLDNLCEGFMNIKDIGLDVNSFFLDEKNYEWVNKDKRMTIKLGDYLDVKLANVDLNKGQIDFVAVN